MENIKNCELNKNYKGINEDGKEFFRLSNANTLAFLGDAVYELFVREYVIKKGIIGADNLHKEAVKYVKANAQAKVIKYLVRNLEDSPIVLTDEEISLIKRTRNHKSSQKSRSADPREYKWATAFEALIGALWQIGEQDRAKEIMRVSIELINKMPKKGNKKRKKYE